MALHSRPVRWPVGIANLPTQLLTLAGMAVVAFEIGFIALVWMRPIRPFLGLAGLAFHRGSRYVLGISFSFLTPAYAGLFDWSAIGRGLTRRLGGEPLLVFYDGHCRLCRRAMALLRSVDLFDAIEPVPADDPRRNRHPALTDEALAHDLHAVGGGTVARGYEAYLRIAGRLPLLWPAALLMRLPAVAAAGRRWYRRVSDSRACAAARPARQPSAPAPHRHVVARGARRCARGRPGGGERGTARRVGHRRAGDDRVVVAARVALRPLPEVHRHAITGPPRGLAAPWRGVPRQARGPVPARCLPPSRPSGPRPLGAPHATHPGAHGRREAARAIPRSPPRAVALIRRSTAW